MKIDDRNINQFDTEISSIFKNHFTTNPNITPLIVVIRKNTMKSNRISLGVDA